MMQSVLAPPTLNFLFAKCSQSQVSHLKMCEMLLKGPHLGYSPSTMLFRYNRRKKLWYIVIMFLITTTSGTTDILGKMNTSVENIY